MLLSGGINSNGKFSVKSLYRSLSPPTGISFPAAQIWTPLVPPKVAFLSWTAAWGKCLTIDILQSKGFSLSNWCVLCKAELESIDHLFLHCKASTELWTSCLAIFGMHWVQSATVRQVLASWRCRSTNNRGRDGWRTVPHAIFWSLWRERNKRTFEDLESTAEQLKNTCIGLLFCWSNLEFFENRMNSQIFF